MAATSRGKHSRKTIHEKKMKNIKNTLFVIMMMTPFASSAQNALPKCEGTDVKSWNECFGVHKSSDGILYEGGFKNGQYSYGGRLLMPNGDSYIGRMENGVPNGRGEAKLESGEIYRGNFVNGELQGQGEQVFSNGSTYKGAFKDSRKDGDGELLTADGSKFVGKFANDKRHGRGIQYLPNGSVELEGIWKDDKFIGKN